MPWMPLLVVAAVCRVVPSSDPWSMVAAIGTIVLAIVTAVSVWVAVLVPRQIELQREADFREERQREEAKAEINRQARLRMVAAILSALSVRVLSLLQGVKSGGIQSNEQFTFGVNEMLGALLVPEVCSAITDPMLAASLYNVTTFTSQVLCSPQWIYQQGRTQGYINAAEISLTGASDKLLDIARQISIDGLPPDAAATA